MKEEGPFSLTVAIVIMTLVGAMGCSLLPIPRAEPEIEFGPRRDVIEAGECTYLEWEVQVAEDYPVVLTRNEWSSR